VKCDSLRAASISHWAKLHFKSLSKEGKDNESFRLDQQKLILCIKNNEIEGFDFKRILRLYSADLVSVIKKDRWNGNILEGNCSTFIGSTSSSKAWNGLAPRVGRESWLPLQSRRKRCKITCRSIVDVWTKSAE
jgi:hypothetical protein